MDSKESFKIQINELDHCYELLNAMRDKTESCNEKYDQLKRFAFEYAQLRVQSSMASDEEFVRMNQERTEAHDRLIGVLTNYVEEQLDLVNCEDVDKIKGFISDRKNVGDLACYFFFVEGIGAR